MSEQQQQNKTDRPRTRGNQRPQQQRGGNQNKQNRGGYRAKDNNEEKRPQTEGGNRNKNNNTRGGPNTRSNNNRNDRGNRQRREENPESWAYRYRHDERPKYENVQVTKDTVIPEVPTKADRLKQPSQEAFTKNMEEFESQVRTKRDQIRNIIKKKSEIIEGGKIGNTSVTYKQALNDKLSVMKTVIAKKRELQNEINNINADIEVFQTEQNKLKKSMHRDYKNLEEIKEAIKYIESRLETTSLSMQEEKKLIRELETLKNSVPAAERFAAIKPDVKKHQDRRNEVYGDLKKVREEVNDVQAEIEALRKELDAVREGQNDQKEVLDDLSSKIDKLNDEITSIYKKKDETRDQYFHTKFDFECQQNLVRHVDWLTKQKDWVIKQEQEQKERVEEQKEAMLNRPNPFFKELEYVDHLVNYCHKLQVDAGLIKDSEVVARETQKNLLSEMNREEVAKKINDGKLQAAESKEDRQNQGMMQLGQGKKRKGKKPKAKDIAEDVFNIDIVVVQKFGFLKVSPPIAPEDLEDKIKELNDKKHHYLTEGEKFLKEEEEEFKKSLEAPVVETPQEEETKETAENTEDRPRNNRGGRGGYGRGGRGNNRGNRGAYGSRPIRAERQEFEGSDDEEERKERPKPKQRNQNQKFNAEDEENFPTF